MDEKITSLTAARAIKQADNRLWGPVDCLEAALKDVKEKPCDRLVVIRIDTADETFTVGYHAAQIKGSEIIAALEILKAVILEEMGY